MRRKSVIVAVYVMLFGIGTSAPSQDSTETNLQARLQVASLLRTRAAALLYRVTLT